MTGFECLAAPQRHAEPCRAAWHKITALNAAQLLVQVGEVIFVNVKIVNEFLSEQQVPLIGANIDQMEAT